jgi:hypothetical protein
VRGVPRARRLNVSTQTAADTQRPAGFVWRRRSGLHYLHHKEGMHHNYSMCDFTFDLLSGNLINMYRPRPIVTTIRNTVWID